MRMLIGIMLVSIASLSAACTIDSKYIHDNLSKTIDEATAVFSGQVVQIINYESKEHANELIVTSVKNEPSIQSELLIVEVKNNFKGSRTKYILETGTVCRSFSIVVGTEYIFFAKNSGSIVYQNIAIELASKKLLSQLELMSSEKP